MTLRIEERPDEAGVFAQKVTFIDHRRSTSSIIDHRNVGGGRAPSVGLDS
ncbi:hypothetical protein [Burkholderia cenocepacia]|nr:hypothetical protein [Burkholderia cenocepacia]